MSRRLPPMYRVTIAGHDVPPRWHIEARTFKLPAPTADFACAQAIGWAHADARLPPWRPCRRVSLNYTTATLVSEASVTRIATRPSTGQLELFGRQAA